MPKETSHGKAHKPNTVHPWRCGKARIFAPPRPLGEKVLSGYIHESRKMSTELVNVKQRMR